MNEIRRKSDESLSCYFLCYFTETIGKNLHELSVEECLSALDIAQSKYVDMNFTKLKTVSITNIKRYNRKAPNKYLARGGPTTYQINQGKHLYFRSYFEDYCK